MSKLQAWLCGIVIMVAAGAAQAAEFTDAHTIGYIIMDASAYQFSPSSGGWGSPSCSSASSMVIPRSNTGAKDMFALLLMARTQGLNVIGYGSCDGSGTIFYPIWLEVY